MNNRLKVQGWAVSDDDDVFAFILPLIGAARGGCQAPMRALGTTPNQTPGRLRLSMRVSSLSSLSAAASQAS